MDRKEVGTLNFRRLRFQEERGQGGLTESSSKALGLSRACRPLGIGSLSRWEYDFGWRAGCWRCQSESANENSFLSCEYMRVSPARALLPSEYPD